LNSLDEVITWAEVLDLTALKPDMGAYLLRHWRDCDAANRLTKKIAEPLLLDGHRPWNGDEDRRPLMAERAALALPSPGTSEADPMSEAHREPKSRHSPNVRPW